MTSSSSSSSSSFYVIAPSNTNIEGNRTNSFRIRLPRKLQFNSEWHVGLAVLVYPHSWPALGTTSEQYVDVVWITGETVRIPVPSASLSTPMELQAHLRRSLDAGSEELARKLRTIQTDYGQLVFGVAAWAKREHERLKAEASKKRRHQKEESQASAVSDILDAADMEGAEQVLEKRAAAAKQYEGIPSEDELYVQHLNEEIAKLDDEVKHALDATKERGLEAWVHAYRRAIFACRFDFETKTNRFSVFLDKKFLHRVELTEQLAYILGFDKQVLTESESAKFMPDMSGGVSSFHVYAPGLIEPMMIGDVTAPLLRLVTIRGKQDEIVEEQFLSIQYHKILIKEISEIFFEIRSSTGALMPFQYGTCTLTLHFKKSSYF